MQLSTASTMIPSRRCVQDTTSGKRGRRKSPSVTTPSNVRQLATVQAHNSLVMMMAGNKLCESSLPRIWQRLKVVQISVPYERKFYGQTSGEKALYYTRVSTVLWAYFYSASPRYRFDKEGSYSFSRNTNIGFVYRKVYFSGGSCLVKFQVADSFLPLTSSRVAQKSRP